MKALAASAVCVALATPAWADDAPPDTATTVTAAATPPPLKVLPDRQGYAFDRPAILLRQRLFGRAHGLSLLAAACLDLPPHSKPIQDAYAGWHARQAKTVETIFRDLSSHYFGPRAEEARWPDLSRALSLPDDIGPVLGQVTLHAACASLPDAIGRPRYELDRMLTEGLGAEDEPVTPGTFAGPSSGIPVTQSAAAPTIRPAAE